MDKHGNRGVEAAICRDVQGFFSWNIYLGGSWYLTLAKDLNTHRAYIVSDFLEVINSIREPSRCSYYLILCEID
jgi:hypothetical protein